MPSGAIAVTWANLETVSARASAKPMKSATSNVAAPQMHQLALFRVCRFLVIAPTRFEECRVASARVSRQRDRFRAMHFRASWHSNVGCQTNDVRNNTPSAGEGKVFFVVLEA